MSDYKILGNAGPGGGGISPTPPANVTAIAVTGFIDPVTLNITLTVSVTPPGGWTGTGCHLFLECPDQSSANAFTVGTSAVGGTDAVQGPWSTIDCGRQPYVASQQPWTISVPGPPGVDASSNIPSRLYAVSFNASVENPLVQANQASPSPSQTFTLVSLASGTPTAGTTVTDVAGPIAVSALPAQNVNGTLESPFLVTVSTAPDNIQGWVARMVVTWGGNDPTNPANWVIVGSATTTAGPIYAPPGDGISFPHSFILRTPNTVMTGTLWLQSGLKQAISYTPKPRATASTSGTAAVIGTGRQTPVAGAGRGGSSDGNASWNPIVPGITPQFPISLGSSTGTVDAASVMLASINAAMAVTNGLFGVAAAGITNSFLGSGAVATINIQNLAVTNPLLASLAVQAANLATGSVTATAIGAAAVGTAAIQNAAITNALIANLAVSGAQIQSATITGANIGFATIAGANIGTATIAQSNMASASIGTAQIINASITDALISDCSINKLTTGTATFTGTALFQNSGATAYVQISSGGVTIVGGTLTSPSINGGSMSGTSLTITVGTTTIDIDSTNFVKISDPTTTNLTNQMTVTGMAIVSTANSQSCTIGVGGISGTATSGGGGFSFGLHGFGIAMPTGSGTGFAINTALSGNYLSGSASSGSDSLPASPAGFLVCTIANATQKIPYYNV